MARNKKKKVIETPEPEPEPEAKEDVVIAPLYSLGDTVVIADSVGEGMKELSGAKATVVALYSKEEGDSSQPYLVCIDTPYLLYEDELEGV